MAGSSNRPMMLYHETHQSKLQVLHCINAVLQGPFFSDQDLTDLASSLSKIDPTLPSFDDDIDGSFSLKVLEAALEIWGLRIVPMEPEVDPEKAFVCHSQDRWVCLRILDEEWYSFDGAHDVPERLPRPGIGDHFNALLDDGWRIYAVRGDLPSECPDSSNKYGKWVPPEYARGAMKSPEEVFMQKEDEDWKAAITASLAEQKSIMNAEEEDLKAAIDASLRDWEHGVVGEPAEAEETSIEPAERGTESEKARGGDDGLGGSEG
ncbi:hypothetical protein QJS10_CPA07g00059 [Acorus calamus]|uniref:ubiquitinyl hydrolase 1 n=1 Tax=Acorus calamus TaxID=4465 RepID=A0AAV9EEB2_ACOCL|nr:hypothetical protein QJS10_CPA07g00059 [Acorus calamus]